MEPNRRDAAVHTPYSDGAGVTPSPETTERRRRPKRKASSATLSPSSSGPSKRPAREKVTATVLPPIHNGPLTRARQLSDNAATSSALNAVKNEGSLAVEKEREEVRLARENFEALESAIEAEVDAIRSRDVNVHVVPVPAGWFSWTKVHSIEKQSLPSFFNGKVESQSPQIYIEIRNEIMKKFHANPGVNIESKDLSDLSKGELDARKEVMEFLDYWGLINYHPFPPKDPTSLDANSKLDTDNIDNSENMDSLIDKLYQFDTDQMSSVMVPRPNVSKPGTSMGLFPYSAVAEELGKLKGPSVEYHCNSCSADCSRKRYHCQKQADFDLCTDCYNNGKFGSNMSPSDFILMEPAEASGASGGKWTDQETLLLLEALELFKENWNEIAEHVATKTKAQCILHFLQMPIEDTFLDCDDDEIEDSMPENTGLSSTNDEDASVPKDKAGPSESKTSATEVEPVSTQTETSNPVDGEDQKIDGKVADEKGEDAQNREVVAKAAKEKGDDRQDINVDQVKGDGVVLKALREAFEVVGAPVAFQEKFSFAEAGNPVMALAAFLTRIVDPGIATATAHGSLKSISSSSPGMQLAARHCFILEDPPDDKTEQTGAAAEKNDSDPMEVENEVGRNRETENQNADNSRDMEQKNTSSVDKTDSMDNKNHDEKDSTASRENRPVTRELRDRGKKKTRASKRNTQNASHEKVEQNIVNESENPDLKKDVAPNVAKEGDDSGSKVEVSSESVKESGDADASKDLDTKSASIRSSPVAADSVEEVGANIGANRTEDDDKNGDAGSAKIKDDMNVDKLKCAAVTTLAAAAVKAKILANQEEDEIRQLATLLIEKQMRKLEVKLSFFAEMENAILRVREQLDRSRQKLYHERAQIIATRLGLPPNASRSIPPSLPRPQMGVVAQRPPLSNPVTTSGISIPENVPSFRTS